MEEDQNPPPKKKTKKQLQLAPTKKLSAIYRLSPIHRKYVLALKRTNPPFNQTEAYMIAYNQLDKDLAAQSASRLMKDETIKEAVSDLILETDVIQTESLEKIVSRFVKLAETSTREADRIRANELLAKIHPERFLDDRNQNTINIIAGQDELQAIRDRLKAKGKWIENDQNNPTQSLPEPSNTESKPITDQDSVSK